MSQSDQDRLDRNRQPYGKGALVNAVDVAVHFRRAYGAHLAPATIRQWASRRHIGSYGHRRERYDIREIVAYALRRGIIPTTPRGILRSTTTEGA